MYDWVQSQDGKQAWDDLTYPGIPVNVPYHERQWGCARKRVTFRDRSSSPLVALVPQECYDRGAEAHGKH